MDFHKSWYESYAIRNPLTSAFQTPTTNKNMAAVRIFM